MTLTSPVDYSILPLTIVIFKELLVGIIIGFISYAFIRLLCDGANHRYENWLWYGKCDRSTK